MVKMIRIKPHGLDQVQCTCREWLKSQPWTDEVLDLILKRDAVVKYLRRRKEPSVELVTIRMCSTLTRIARVPTDDTTLSGCCLLLHGRSTSTYYWRTETNIKSTSRLSKYDLCIPWISANLQPPKDKTSQKPRSTCYFLDLLDSLASQEGPGLPEIPLKYDYWHTWSSFPHILIICGHLERVYFYQL